MSVFKKQGVYWIDYYVNGRRKRERIGPDKKLAETVLQKRKVAIAEGKYLEKARAPLHLQRAGRALSAVGASEPSGLCRHQKPSGAALSGVR
jgi:hypothetical protein